MSDLTRAILNTLLREDFRGLRTRGRIADGLLHHRDLAIPVQPDGFLCDIAVAEPVVIQHGRRHADLTSILAALRTLVEPVDLPGYDDFTRECHAAETTDRIQRHHRAAALRRIGVPGRGMAGSLAYDSLAAFAGHPVYPTGNARVGVSHRDQLRYAPEHHTTCTLRWTGVPAETVTGEGTLPSWWPTAADLDLPPDHVPFPVHPLTGTGRPSRILVRPTLSMRTLAVQADPYTHVKVPLPTSSLGARNRLDTAPVADRKSVV